MTARVGVVVFPGTNCEYDVIETAVERAGGTAELVWHASTSLGASDAIVIAGGFAHGDYLRPGAIARFSPVMEAVGKAAAEGMPVVGVCNGFQVLTEAGLLPGALQKNAGPVVPVPGNDPAGRDRPRLAYQRRTNRHNAADSHQSLRRELHRRTRDAGRNPCQ